MREKIRSFGEEKLKLNFIFTHIVIILFALLRFDCIFFDFPEKVNQRDIITVENCLVIAEKYGDKYLL
jgi:hypothetical protein